MKDMINFWERSRSYLGDPNYDRGIGHCFVFDAGMRPVQCLSVRLQTVHHGFTFKFNTEICFMTVTLILMFLVVVAVVVAFFICWAPFHAQRLMTIYIREDQWTPLWLELQSHLFYISGRLSIVSP